MITVILPLQMQACLLVSLIISLGHPLNIGFQLRQQFLLGDAAEGTEVIAHTDILQIVQFAEDAQLAELADTRDKRKRRYCPSPLRGLKNLRISLRSCCCKRASELLSSRGASYSSISTTTGFPVLA